MKGVNTFLMFNDQAEEAVRFYVDTFPRAKLLKLVLSDGDNPIPKGKVLQAAFEIDGSTFYATDGGPDFTFSMGFSLYVNCETQQEIDDLDAKLLANGGQQLDCGWVKDRFGVFWQLVPVMLTEIQLGPDKARAKRVFDALLKMQKIDIATLERAAAGEAEAA
ncbi:MAG: VOC family protein [Bauldia sp.]|nr:VOC family protein [Bauldia sp.]